MSFFIFFKPPHTIHVTARHPAGHTSLSSSTMKKHTPKSRILIRDCNATMKSGSDCHVHKVASLDEKTRNKDKNLIREISQVFASVGKCVYKK
jgi:hypothetical protein